MSRALTVSDLRIPRESWIVLVPSSREAFQKPIAPEC